MSTRSRPSPRLVDEHVRAARHARRRRSAVPSSTGSFWRVRISAVGPVAVEVDAPRLAAISLASAGRITRRPGIARSDGELLDRLVGRAVLADADRVVRPDEDDLVPA